LSDDFLRTQLRQAQDALTTAERLRSAAEGQYREAVAKLSEIARSLLPAEWNALRREHPEADTWLPQRLANWVVETGRRKLNRLEMLTQGDLAQEVEALACERDNLAAQLRQAQDTLATLGAGYKSAQEQLQARDVELAQLRSEVVAHRKREKASPETAAAAMVTTFTDADLAAWQASAAFARDRQALHAIGRHGFCLRAEVAKAIGIADATSGTARQIFENLSALDLLEQERPKSERAGQTPYFLRLTDRGREVYRALFGEEPVASEYDRLLSRHKSPEHVLLNLQARDALEAAGAESVDLYPHPVSLLTGGTFDVDLVAVFDGKPLYVEAERGSASKKRPQKWTNYAIVTKDFYIVVPNTKAKSRLISETDRWACENPEAAKGVTRHVCLLPDFDGQTLWQMVTPLSGRGRK
jgi:DNA-binding MarR family transcriptional regulator